MGNGSGQFTSQIAYAVGGGPQSIAAGILTGDPASTTLPIDLVVANRYDSTLTVLLNNGNGGFTATADSPIAAGSNSAAVAIGDINNDKFADLVTANEGGDSVSVLLNQAGGSGKFDAAVSFSVGRYPDAVTLGDFNSDGHLDVATANHLGTTSSITRNNVSVLLGGQRYAASVEYTVYDTTTSAIGTSPNQAVLGKLNADIYPDIVTVNQQSGNLSVLLNDVAAPGTFKKPLAPLPVTNPNPQSVALGHLGGGAGNLDAVVCCVGAGGVGTVSILKGNGDGNIPAASIHGRFRQQTCLHSPSGRRRRRKS